MRWGQAPRAASAMAIHRLVHVHGVHTGRWTGGNFSRRPRGRAARARNRVSDRPRFLVLGWRSHAQNEQLKRAHPKQQNCDCDPIIFEPMPAHRMHARPSLLTDSPITLAHSCFRAISQESILVSRFVVKTRPTFRSLWRKSGMVVDLPTRDPIWQRCSARRSMKDAVDAIREVHRLICWG